MFEDVFSACLCLELSKIICSLLAGQWMLDVSAVVVL